MNGLSRISILSWTSPKKLEVGAMHVPQDKTVGGGVGGIRRGVFGVWYPMKERPLEKKSKL